MLSLSWERKLGFPSIDVAGVDEVGRGCLAGPVVAVALVPPREMAHKDYPFQPWFLQIQDSKKLRPKLREYLDGEIRHWASAIGVGVCSESEIDTLNIFQASLLAMQRAVLALAVEPQAVLVDGAFLPLFKAPLRKASLALVQGDQKSFCVAAASIVAKVWRDQKMFEYHQMYPAYGFDQHKGYPTYLHKKALKLVGRSPIHRISFRPLHGVPQAKSQESILNL